MCFYAALGPFGIFPPESDKNARVWAPQGHEVSCFIGPIATRAGGVARGPLQGVPGVAGGRPEAAGGSGFDPDGKTRGI